MMKKTTMILALLLASLTAWCRDGYHISLKMPDVQDSMVYLVHYYGQGRPHIYITDSTHFDKKGLAVFDSKKPDFVGGIYIVLLKDKEQTNFELLLNKGDEMTVTATKSRLPDGVQVKGSPENERFLKYMDFIKGYAAEQKLLEEAYKNARTTADSAGVRTRSAALARQRLQYTRDYAAAYPGTLLAAVFNAMEAPEVPEGQHLLEDGTTKDSAYAYRYYKSHYWDKFNFQDDRLIYTPLYDSRIEEYMTKMVVQLPDSVERECDMLLKSAHGTKDMFHYTLYWLTRYAENSKIMGMDEVFVYLVENYYMKGDAFWLSNEELTKYIDRARAIAPNVIGNVAPELKLRNVFSHKEESLLGLKAKYTLLVFYSPTCGHCQHELPLLDSVYEAVLKDKGVKVLTMSIDQTEKEIADFLMKHNLDKKWINTADSARLSGYRDKYDVFSTPTIYLLDEKKIIRGKRLDHSNIASVIDMLEKRKLAKH